MFKASQSPLVGKAFNWLNENNPKIQLIKNPCSFDEEELWKVIDAAVPLVPNEIEYMLEENSNNIFERSMEKLKNEMILWIDNRDFEPILSTITILDSLNNHIPDLVGSCLEYAIDKITSTILKEHENAKSTIGIILSRKACSHVEVKSLENFFTLIDCSKNFRNLELSQKLDDVENFENWLIEALQNFESMIQLDEKTNFTELNWAQIVSPTLEILLCLSQLKCAAIKQMYDQNCGEITKYLQNISKGLKKAFQDITFLLDIRNIIRLSVTLNCLRESSVIIQHMKNNFDQTNEINQLQVKFTNIIKQSHQDLQEKLHKIGSSELSDLDNILNEIREIFDANKLVSERYELFNYFGEDQCKQCFEIVNQSLEESINEYLEHLKRYTASMNSDQTNINNLKLYSKICNELIKLSNNTKFAKMLTPSFSSSKTYIKNLCKKLQQAISPVEKDNHSINIMQAANILNKLHKLMLFDEMNSNTYVSKKYEHSKQLVFSKSDSLIDSLDYYWKLNSFGKFNEMICHIRSLDKVFLKIGYGKGTSVYETQKNTYIDKISTCCETFSKTDQIDEKFINYSLMLLNEFKNELLEFTFDIQQLITKTESNIISKIENLIREKLDLLNKHGVTDISKSTEQPNHLENIRDALNFLYSCKSSTILQDKLSKQNYYDEGKTPIQNTLTEIQLKFDSHVNNFEFVKAREFYVLFLKYSKLGSTHFPSIFQQCAELRNKLNTETNAIKEIETILGNKGFRKIKGFYQNISEDCNKRKVIDQIIDFLHEYFTKLLSNCNSFEPVTTRSEFDFVEVTSESMEEVKQIALFKTQLNVDESIDNVIAQFEVQLQEKFIEIFTNSLADTEEHYKKYYVSTCNCIRINLEKSYAKINSCIDISKLDIVAKLSALKHKYEKKLLLDLKNALTNDNMVQFTEIWRASNKIPKRSFSESDEILEQVEKEIERYYNDKIQSSNSVSVLELEKTIEKLQSIVKFPENILNQLKTKLSDSTSKLATLKERFNQLLKSNDYDKSRDSLTEHKNSNNQLFEELVRSAQEHFDQHIKIVKLKYKGGDYFDDDLRCVYDCRDKIGHELNLNKFDELIKELSSNFTALVRVICTLIENQEILHCTTKFELFLKLIKSIRSVKSVQNKLDCVERIHNYYSALYNKLLDARQHAKIPVISDCLKIISESQPLIELILSNEKLLSIQQDFGSLLRNLYKTKIQEYIDTFLQEKIIFFEVAKQNRDYCSISVQANLLNDIPQYLTKYSNEKTAEIVQFKNVLIEEIKQIDFSKIIELWESNQYQEIEGILKFVDQVSPVISFFRIAVPNLKGKLCNLVRQKFNEMNNDADECAQNFITYGRIGEIITCLRKPIIEEITRKTTSFSKQHNILSLYTSLRNHGNSSNENSIIAEYILGECPNFKSFMFKLINKQRTFSSENTLQKILQSRNNGTTYTQLDATEISELQNLYRSCEGIYNNLLKEHLGSPNFIAIVNKVKILVKNNPKQNLAEIVANIFALWSLTNSELEFISKTQDLDYFKKPHPVQMISIFMLLSFNKPSKHFENQLIEIRTGEGKSITLGVCAIIFALMGYQADVVCYSKILSSRDENDFRNLFDQFGVTSRIKYYTIDNLCENIINEGEKLRDTVNNFLINKQSEKKDNKQQQPNRPRVCLIDEADEFTSKLFLGKSYTPISIIQDEDFFGIAELVWTRRHSNQRLSLFDIRKENAYKALITKYPNITFIFDLQIQELLNDVRNFDDPELPEAYFDVGANKIGYKHHDEIDYDIYLKHKTTFQYFDKFERQQISKAVLKKRIGFYICCGRFSFAEIPKQSAYILGLTGTLNLHPTQIQIVKNQYKINTFTKMPSMYGESQLKFDSRDDLFILSNLDEYYIKLKTEIELALNNKRAILVFFENEARLNSFKQSSYCPESCNVIVESSMDKNRLFRKATISSTCTLLTKVFGRGTDFSVKDKDVVNNNGILVIQAFFSDSFSEEIQIKGRTARQGSKGQFMIILLKNDITKLFDLTENSPPFASANQLYDQLDTWRKNKITKISAGYDHSLFENNKREIFACGSNEQGQCGLGHFNNPQITPSLILNLPENIVHFICGGGQSLFLDSEGNVFSVGYNEFGQLGLGHNADQNKLNKIPNIPPIKTISCVNSSCYLIDFERNFWAFGANEYGQLGDGDETYIDTPKIMNALENIQQIS